MKSNIIITAILAIAGLMGWALYLGHNGQLLLAIVAVIAGLAGLVTPTPKILKLK